MKGVPTIDDIRTAFEDDASLRASLDGAREINEVLKKRIGELEDAERSAFARAEKAEADAATWQRIAYTNPERADWLEITEMLRPFAVPGDDGDFVKNVLRRVVARLAEAEGNLKKLQGAAGAVIAAISVDDSLDAIVRLGEVLQETRK